MSYGQPCKRMTGGPSAGPASAYATFKTPASICFSGLKVVPCAGLRVGRLWAYFDAVGESKMPSGAAVAATAAPPTRSRRRKSISLTILGVFIGETLVDADQISKC